MNNNNMGNAYIDVALLEKPRAEVGSLRKVSWKPSGTQFRYQAPQHLTFLQPSIDLFNIPFNIRHEDDFVYVESPQWPSLQSYGSTVHEAISDMLGLIHNVIQEYVLVPESELAGDAIEFRRFLIQKLLA